MKLKNLAIPLAPLALFTPRFALAAYDDMQHYGFVLWLLKCGGGTDVDGNAVPMCTLTNVLQAAVRLINWAIMLSGLVAVIFIVLSGYKMIQAGLTGDEKAYGQGRAGVQNAVIGMLIIAVSFVLVNSVMSLVFGQSYWFNF